MRWQMGRRSDNVEDRRGGGSSGTVMIGGGLGTILLVLAALFLGVDPSVVLQQAPLTNAPSSTQTTQIENDPRADFVSVILADTEDTWHQIFRQSQLAYREPKLVLFSGAVQSACGFAQAAMGPFYCPNDQKVYLDLSFFDDLRNRHHSPGDFAQAYVIAHEIGHHVQTLLGISQQVHQAQQRVGKVQGNQLSVRLELQADCFAGVWAHHSNQTRQTLEPGDIEEAINAASNIGDDRLQKQAQGYVVPDSFTHGSSAQRMRWFQKGLKTGDPDQCNTFETNNL